MSEDLKDMKNFQIDLAKYLAEKDFIYGPEPELYNPVAGFYTYGLLGKSMKNNLESVIRKVFTNNNFFEVEYPLVTPEIVWKASGHLDGFNDPVVICSKCKSSLRADKIIEEQTGIAADTFDDKKLIETIKEHEVNCPNCKGRFDLEIHRHSLMMKTTIGTNTVAYNRPETATTTYLPFKRYANFFRNKLPFSVFQIGKAFRNEISPRQHLLRQREFTQAEAQMFLSKDQKENFELFEKVKEEKLPLWTEDMQKSNKDFDLISLNDAMKKKYLKNKAYAWNLWLSFKIITSVGIPVENIRFRQHHSDEKAFYSDDTWDLEVKLNSFGWVEMVGISDRTNYDLTQHSKFSKTDLEVRLDNGEKIIPDVIEIAFGVDRPFFALLDLAFSRRSEDAKRTVLSLPYNIAPLQVGLLPLMKKDGLPEKASEIREILDKDFRVYEDLSGSIGKRYSRLDAVGVPFCITIDHDSLKDDSVTIRERDTLKQIRVKKDDLVVTLKNFLENGFSE
jgi:glycyl-tRNA synthetase